MLDPQELPLAGVRVLDFSQFLAGPVAALRLADLGASVVKIERPDSGEIGRTLAFAGRWIDGDTASFHAMNRNKRAVIADLKDRVDRAMVLELVAWSDVLVQNFRPGVMARLGLGYEALRTVNPGLIYASATGYGETGPWADRPGQDLLAQSVSGLAWASGERFPVPVGLALADHLMSCHIAQGVLALLVRKARTGLGGLVETSLLEAMLDLQSEQLVDGLNAAECPAGVDAGSAPVSAVSGVFPTKDGHLAIGMAPIAELASLLPCPGLDLGVSSELRLPEVERLLRPVLATRSTRDWLRRLEPAGPWFAPVLTLEQMLADPAFAAVEMTQEVVRAPRDASATPLAIRTTRSPLRVDGEPLLASRAAPRLGQDGHVRDELARVEAAQGGSDATRRQTHISRLRAWQP